MDVSEAKAWSGGLRHPWEHARFQVVQALSKSTPLSRFRPGATVIDVGCGDGYVLRKLGENGREMHLIGIDPGIVAGETGTYPDGIEWCVTLSQASATVKKKVSHVTLLDVLEHVPDDRKLLEEVTSTLPVDAETTFIITAPAFQFLFSSHDTALGHFRRYSLRQLRDVLGRAGFHIENDGYFFTLPLLLRLVRVVIERVFPGTASRQSDLLRTGRAPLVVWKLMVVLLLFDYNCGAMVRRLGINLGGLSVFAVCRKST